jgi:phenylacetate-coenzyme A ligase PaaK-like adenylate-forming protein
VNRSRIDAYIMEKEALPEVTRESLDALKLGKLNALLKREKERGGFYKNLPERLDSLEELKNLPFTTEENLAQNAPGLLLCSQSKIRRVLSDATSGTTGAAKRVFYTEGDLENTIQLYMAGLGELIFPGSVTLICFPFSGPFGLGELIAEAITRLGARPVKAGPFLSFGEYAALMESEKPDTFVGMPVQLLGILRFCGKGSLRRALVSGDACPDSVMSGCEEILGTKLFPHYGSREMGMAGAISCEAHEGMHLREDDVIAEIVDEDGRVLPTGERGELVVTTIGMEAMPLIRYRTGDCTRILPGHCPCGSAALRLDRVTRKASALSADALDEILFADPTVVDCRYEHAGERLAITALTNGASGETALLSRLRAAVPALQIVLTTRPAGPEEHALYVGKRTIARPVAPDAKEQEYMVPRLHKKETKSQKTKEYQHLRGYEQ